MADIFGLQGEGEASDREQPSTTLRRGWRTSGPVEHAGGAHKLVPLCLREGYEVPEHRMLDAELEAHRTVEVDISRQILAQHDTPPGQGCAI